jgi:hypothetical protein
MVTRNLFGCIGHLPLATCVFTIIRMSIRKADDRLQLIPANRTGLAVARWRMRSDCDDLELEIFQEALVEPGLVEAIVLSVVLLQSGRSLGDRIETMTFSDPRFVWTTSGSA